MGDKRRRSDAQSAIGWACQGNMGCRVAGQETDEPGVVDDLDFAVRDGEAVSLVEGEGTGVIQGAGVDDHAARPVARGGGDRIGEQPAAEGRFRSGRE